MYSSIYEAMEYPDAKEMELKSDLVMLIAKTIREKNVTQAEVADMAGLTQPQVSDILRGKFRKVTLERIFRILNNLDREVRITVYEKEHAETLLDRGEPVPA